jgi:hypothetical protein
MEINSKMASKDGITEKEVLSLGNAVLTQAGGPTKTISSIRQFNSVFFSELFQSLPITSSLCIDSTLIPLTTSEAHRCQIIINKLSKCLPPQVSLSHIKGSDISQGNLLAIKNLIEIFAVLLEASLTDDSGSDSGSDDDSNVITGEGNLPLSPSFLFFFLTLPFSLSHSFSFIFITFKRFKCHQQSFERRID